MVRIVVDDNLESQLAAADRSVELCCPNGRVLGRFTPTGRTPRMQPEDHCPYSDDELREACAQPLEGRPLGEIWKDLGRT